jgi:N-acetylglucosaminyl-diphospho-decaprenol L-rhamnosyltransferase
VTRIVSQYPAVSVLIVNYASGPHLSNCVRALAGQSLSNIEIIVVDNCSRDDSFANARAAVAEDKRFSFLEAGTNLGFAAGNNFAAARARGAWFALLNPDAVPAPDWLEQLLAATRRHPDVVMFGSTQIDGIDPERLDGVGDHYLAIGLPWRGGHGWSVKSLPREREVFAPCAAACLLRADIFRAANGFDERFFCYVEDIDLAFRLRLEGHRCIQVSGAVVRHVGAVSSRGKGSDFAHRCGSRNLIWCFVNGGTRITRARRKGSPQVR